MAPPPLLAEGFSPNPGQVVRVRTRTYLVESVEPSALKNGLRLVRLSCLDDDAQGQPLEVIWELELDTAVLGRDAWKNIGHRGFDSPRLFSAYLHTLRWNCVTATDPRLFQSPFRAGIRIDAYQLEPLRKALLLPRVNLFIADDVGLGKTIEAGLIASELILRRRVREIVVACPPAMIGQWKDELEQRFGLTFEVLDREFLERVRRERGYGVNPWATFPRFLISHKLLIDETYTGPLRAWLDNLRPGSMLILDEAHHAAPASGARYAIDSRITRAIRDLAPRFEHRLFLSATPHNGHSNSFSALLELLDPQRFTRGVKVLKRNLDDVMVRRLKDDLRSLNQGGFPKRDVVQVDIKDLPEDTPELALSRLLDRYRTVRQQRLAVATRRQQNQAALLIGHLQQRLLSSVEAFARTLAVHRRTMERVWAGETETATVPPRLDLLTEGFDRDDDRSRQPEAEQQALLEHQVEAATCATGGDAAKADIATEKSLLAEMERIAQQARHEPDERVRHLVRWVRKHQCASVRVPGEPAGKAGMAWTDLRLIIFTEYDDTRRYLVEQLRTALAGTDRAEARVEVFHGPTPPERREAIKRAFNEPPRKHPVRILVATDAAREGLNLQAHCHHLFHFDVPWNPSRLEQRNGRIDRKLQPAPVVYCHYFVYAQRPEDRVLRALVRKTETIRIELGSLAQVLEARLAESLSGGIAHEAAARIESQINDARLDAEKRAVADEELEANRERQDKLEKQIDTLRKGINTARDWIGLDPDQLRDTLSCALEMLGADALVPATTPPGAPPRFEFPNIATRFGGSPAWATTLDTLRAPPEDGQLPWQWRKEAPIRPVVFTAPDEIDDDIVQLHLSHRIVQRLLSRFLAQGFVHLDLSRACLTQSADAIPRVALLGRLALYGPGATRLHEELLTVTAAWSDPATRRAPLAPYAQRSEEKTLALLETALRPGGAGRVTEQRSRQLLAATARDVEELLPHLEARGRETQADAEARLAERGRIESEAMRKVLDEQRHRVSAELGRTDAAQTLLPLEYQNFTEDERRQLTSNRRYWQRWLENVEGDIRREPARILDFYKVISARIEPVGLAYLWPVTG